MSKFILRLSALIVPEQYAQRYCVGAKEGSVKRSLLANAKRKPANAEQVDRPAPTLPNGASATSERSERFGNDEHAHKRGVSLSQLSAAFGSVIP